MADCPVPFLSIIETSCGEIAAHVPPRDTVGIIGTRATLAAKLFDAQLVALGYVPIAPDDETLNQVVLPAIELVKQGHAKEGGRLLMPVVEQLLARGAAAVILACTEVPLALDAIHSPLRDHCVDSTAALARACVAFWRERQQ